MNLDPVPVDFPLSEDQLVDIFLLQWHTPVPELRGEAIESATLDDYKRAVLNELSSWLTNNPIDRSGPLLILAPEVSLPFDCLDIVESLVSSSTRPTVMIAGLQHIGWDSYCQLIDESDNPVDDSNNPGNQRRLLWKVGGDETQLVNAAAIRLRDAAGNLKRYVQPKLRPNAGEELALVYPADRVLLFHHTDPTPGCGVNFCVQICSDFCNEEHVSLLREKVGRANLRLDFTVLLQHNRDQNVPQFQVAAEAYFAPSAMKAITKNSALLYFNNASSVSGKSASWGQSQFRFSFGTWRLNGAEYTYRLSQKSGEQCQAAIMRESGPSVYWLTYKPEYLVDHRPGTGQEQPFLDARHWYLPSRNLSGDGTAISFSRIPAIAHWLDGEWDQGEEELRVNLETEFRQRRLAQVDESLNRSVARGGAQAERVIPHGYLAILNCYVNAYRTSLLDWRAVILGGRDDKASHSVYTYFLCFLGRDGFPGNTKGHSHTEPARWCSEACTAVKRWLRVYSLLAIGAARIPARLLPSPESRRHALLGDERDVVFLWGGSEFSGKYMVSAYVSQLRVERVSKRILIVLVQALGGVDNTRLREHLDQRVDKAKAPAHTGDHLAAPGEVVVGEQWQLSFLDANDLLGTVNDAEDENQFINALAIVTHSAD
jgi:hypothetical protein